MSSNIPRFNAGKMSNKPRMGNSFASTINYTTGSVEMPEKENRVSNNNNNNVPFHGLNVGSSSSLNYANLNVKQMKVEANKKVQTLKTTIDTISQKFRRSTRRRQRLGELSTFGAKTPIKEHSPVKMYSPFRIDTPSRGTTRARTPARYAANSRRMCDFVSPSQSFHKDVEAVSKGTRQLSSMARGIVTRSSLGK